jgi:hypothetical protein
MLKALCCTWMLGVSTSECLQVGQELLALRRTGVKLPLNRIHVFFEEPLHALAEWTTSNGTVNPLIELWNSLRTGDPGHCRDQRLGEAADHGKACLVSFLAHEPRILGGDL